MWWFPGRFISFYLSVVVVVVFEKEDLGPLAKKKKKKKYSSGLYGVVSVKERIGL